MKINTHSAFEFAFLTHHAFTRTTICGLTKCLPQHHFVLHIISNHETNGKRYRQTVSVHGFIGLTHKMLENLVKTQLCPQLEDKMSRYCYLTNS